MRERDRITALERRVATLEKGNRQGTLDSSRDDSPGEGWRWVREGEVLCGGDEFLPWGFPRASEWRPITHVVGEPCQEIHAYRRRIDAKPNHDAAPAARARTDSATGEPGGGHGSGWTHKPVTRSVLGTGDTQEPVAWAVMSGRRAYDVYDTLGEAEAICRWLCEEESGDIWRVVPLVPAALTDDECEAIELAAYDYLYHQDPGGRSQWIREQLLGLLARTR